MDARRFAPATQRNREPILAVLARVLPPSGRVLEIASGTGEHAVFFASGLPGVIWQPSDLDTDNRASIAAWRAEAGLPNLLAPVALDATVDPWPVAEADAVVNINMIHIAPWAACEGLMCGAGRVLAPGRPLVLYGPFKRNGAHTAESNDAFDRMLRSQNREWGVRDLADVEETARAGGFALEETIVMPANNLSVVFRRRQC